MSKLKNKLEVCVFEMSKDDINELLNADNRFKEFINNPKKEYATTVKLYMQKRVSFIEFFWIIKVKNEMKGDVIRINLKNIHYYDLLWEFCKMINEENNKYAAINLYQHYCFLSAEVISRNDVFEPKKNVPVEVARMCNMS